MKNRFFVDGPGIQLCILIVFTLLIAAAKIAAAITQGLEVLIFCIRLLLLAGCLFTACAALRKIGRLPRTAKAVQIILICLAALGTASFIVVEALIITGSGEDDISGVDILIVAGAATEGERPAPVLANRLDRAYELLVSNPDAVAVLAGGKGDRDEYTEASVMKNYLVAKGIDASRLIEEDRSLDTVQNITYSKEILDGMLGEGRHRVVVVTSEFHIFRTKLIAEKNGLDPYGAPVRTESRRFLYYLREYFSVMIYAAELLGFDIDKAFINSMLFHEYNVMEVKICL